MQITFERESEKRGRARRYAWRILVDGDLRGFIMPSVGGPDYFLRDKTGIAVRRAKDPAHKGMPPVISATSLEQIKLLAENAVRLEYLPTDEQLAQRAAERARREQEDADRDAADRAREQKERAGPALFDALVALNLNPNRPTRGTNDGAWRKLVQQAQDAIRAAGGTS